MLFSRVRICAILRLGISFSCTCWISLPDAIFLPDKCCLNTRLKAPSSASAIVFSCQDNRWPSSHHKMYSSHQSSLHPHLVLADYAPRVSTSLSLSKTDEEVVEVEAEVADFDSLSKTHVEVVEVEAEVADFDSVSSSSSSWWTGISEMAIRAIYLKKIWKPSILVTFLKDSSSLLNQIINLQRQHTHFIPSRAAHMEH